MNPTAFSLAYFIYKALINLYLQSCNLILLFNYKAIKNTNNVHPHKDSVKGKKYMIESSKCPPQTKNKKHQQNLKRRQKN